MLYLDSVADSIERLLPTMPRQDIIRAALEHRGALIQVRDLDEACAIANRIAPEHLELSIADAESWVGKIRHAGAIFVGPIPLNRSGITVPGPIMCFRPQGVRVSRHRWGSMISRSGVA